MLRRKDKLDQLGIRSEFKLDENVMQYTVDTSKANSASNPKELNKYLGDAIEAIRIDGRKNGELEQIVIIPEGDSADKFTSTLSAIALYGDLSLYTSRKIKKLADQIWEKGGEGIIIVEAVIGGILGAAAGYHYSTGFINDISDSWTQYIQPLEGIVLVATPVLATVAGAAVGVVSGVVGGIATDVGLAIGGFVAASPFYFGNKLYRHFNHSLETKLEDYAVMAPKLRPVDATPTQSSVAGN